MNYFKAILSIFNKDVRMELRTKESLNSTIVFSIMVTIVFSFIFEPGSDTKFEVVGGIFWMAITFSGLLSFNKTIINELNGGSLNALMLAPIDRSAIFFGKFLLNFLFLAILEAVLIILFTIFYDINLIADKLSILTFFLATYAYALMGTLFSFISVRTKSRELMLPILMLPILIPIILSAILSTNIFLKGEEIEAAYNYLKIMAIFDIIFSVVIFAVFPLMVEE